MYQPPVSEYAFLYREVFGRDIVAGATDGDVTSDDAVEVLNAASEVAVQSWLPVDQTGDSEGTRIVDGQVETASGFREAYTAYAEGGWTEAVAPESAGGEGLPVVVQAALNEFWSASNCALSLAPGLSFGAIAAIDAVGARELRDIYLPPLVSGRWTGTMNLTEPQAGTDLSAIRTTARQDGDGAWAIRGQKIFITWGDHDLTDNIVHLVLARTEGAPEGLAGLSLFVVPKFVPDGKGNPGVRNSITPVSVEHKLGIHASPTCVLEYEDATGFLLGEVGEGLAAMFVMMNSSRIGIGQQGLGLADRAYQRADSYAAQRVQGRVLGRPKGVPIAEHPDVRRLLLSMSSRIAAMRAMNVYVATLLDEGKSSPGSLAEAEFLVPVLKGWLTEESVTIASDALQVHGGMGFIEDTGAAQHYRDVRIGPIYEGTTAIQANDLVGRKVLRDQGQIADGLLNRIRVTVERLKESDDSRALALGQQLDRAVGAAERATRALLGFGEAPRDAFAGSVPYLTLVGLTVGGWLHGQIALAVLKHEEPSAEDQRRLSEAGFYSVHHLARVHGLVEIIEAGEIT